MFPVDALIDCHTGKINEALLKQLNDAKVDLETAFSLNTARLNHEQLQKLVELRSKIGHLNENEKNELAKLIVDCSGSMHSRDEKNVAPSEVDMSKSTEPNQGTRDKILSNPLKAYHDTVNEKLQDIPLIGDLFGKKKSRNPSP